MTPMQALEKLVALQDLRERADKISPVEPGYEKETLLDLWRSGIRRAWSDARAALAAEKAEPVAWQVWWGLPALRPHWPPYKSKQEADDVAASMKSVTEVRPLCAAPKATP